MIFGFLLFQGLEELDFAGPWELVSIWRACAGGPEKCLTVSESGGEVRCSRGLRICADYDLPSCPKLDALLIPGGEGVAEAVKNEKLVDFVREQGAGCGHVLSVCTGAFLLAAAGLLKGRKATTHWASLGRLRAVPGVEVVEQRYVHDGPVWTAAGVSAGLDMTLAFISQVGGPKAAGVVQLGSEYYPGPEVYQPPLAEDRLPVYIKDWLAGRPGEANFNGQENHRT